MRPRTRRLAEELDALLDDRRAADEVGPEARRLATLATTVVEERPGPAATLTEDRRLAMRDRLLDDIAALEAPAPARTASPARSARSARAALASAVASALIAGTGVTVAAQEALPGDVLYGLKKGTESVRMNLASGETQAARLELRFAEERLEEIAGGAQRLPSERLVDSLAEMDQRAHTGASQLVHRAERTGEEELLVEVDDFIERQSAGIVEVFDRLPVEVRPHAEDSLAMLRAIRVQLLQPAIEACDCLDVTPAGHADEGPFGDMTPQPLPPASEEPTSASEPTSDSDPGSDATGDGGGTTERREDTSRLREPVEDVTSGRTRTGGDGVGSRLLDPLGETGERVGGVVDDTLDRTGETLDRTTDGVGDVVDRTGKLLEDTTDTVEDTLGRTTESVGDLLGSTTDTLGNLGRR